MPPEQPEFADIYYLVCGEDREKWPSLSCAEVDQTVELKTRLGDIAIFTGVTPAERLRVTATGLVQVWGSLSVSNGITVGGKQVIDSSGKWTGEPTGTIAWIDGVDQVTTASKVGIGTANPGLFQLKVEGGDVGIAGNLTVDGTLHGQLAESAVSRSQLNLTLVADWEVEVKSTPNGVNFVIEEREEHTFYLASCRVIGPRPSAVNASVLGGLIVPLIEETKRVNWRHSSKLVPFTGTILPTPFPFPTSPSDPPLPDPDTNLGIFTQVVPVTGWKHYHQVCFENLGTSSVTVAFQVYRLN